MRTLAALAFAFSTLAFAQHTSTQPPCKTYSCCYSDPTNPGCQFNPYRAPLQLVVMAAQ